MKRITVEDVQAAYKKTRLIPFKHFWLSDNCGCAMSACMLANGVTRREILLADVNSECEELAAKRLGLEMVYTNYFVYGFDGCHIATVTEEETFGYQDGKAAAAAIFGESP